MSWSPRRFVLITLALAGSVLLFLLSQTRPEERPVPGMPGKRSHSPTQVSSPAVTESREAVPSAEEEPPPAVETAAEPAAEPERVPKVERPAPGVLQVHVLLEAAGPSGETVPLIGSAVRIAHSKSVYRTAQAPRLDPEDVIAELPVDAGGEVRFENLEPESWYVEARTPNGATRGASLQLKAEEGRRLILRFGSGRVYGVVSDPATLMPVVHAQIMLSIGRTPKGMWHYEGQRELAEQGRMPSSLYAESATDGSFQFDELPSGPLVLWLDPSVYDPASKTRTSIPRRFVEFELGPGETRRFDFPAADSAIWTGRVVTRAGEVIVGPSGKNGTLDVRLRGPVGYRQVQQVADSGSFRIYLPAGVHDVHLISPFNSESSLPFGDEGLTLERGVETKSDIVLPGTRIVGEVLDSSGGSLVDQRGYPVGAHLEGQTHSAAWYSTELKPDGSFVLDGLGPGEWVVKAGRGGAKASLTVRESDLELPVVIHLP